MPGWDLGAAANFSLLMMMMKDLIHKSVHVAVDGYSHPTQKKSTNKNKAQQVLR